MKYRIIPSIYYDGGFCVQYNAGSKWFPKWERIDQREASTIEECRARIAHLTRQPIVFDEQGKEIKP